MLRLHRDSVLTRVNRFSLVVWACALAMMACTQPWNWRVLPLGDTGWEAMMPCKPESAAREMPLADAMVRLEMRSCDAQGLTFAVAWMVLPPNVDANALADQWRQASLRSAKVTQAGRLTPWALRGVSGAQRWTGQGQRNDGRSVGVSLGHAIARGSLVQLAVYGEHGDASGELSTFWEGLGLRQR